MARIFAMLLGLLTIAMMPTETRAACAERVNDPVIDTLSQRGNQIGFDWRHNCEWDHSLVRWVRVGRTGQLERPSDTDGSFYVLGNVRPNTVYTFSVKGCDSPWFGSDTCDPIWLSETILTCGGPRTPCSTNSAGITPIRIRSGVGKCLDVHAPDRRNNGARVQVWDCNGEDQQTWIRRGKAYMTKDGKCLDVHAPDQNLNGARVQIWECNGSPQQQWTSGSGTSIRSAAGKCLDVHRFDQNANGGKVQVWDCNGELQQQWDDQVW